MVKQLHIEMDDEVFDQSSHPGCMWGLFHSLNYHYWQKNVKKLLPYRKNYVPKRSKGTGKPRIRINVHDSGEEDNLLNVEANHIYVNPNTRKSTSTNKKSLRTRIKKALIFEETPKKESHKPKNSSSHTHQAFRRTYSIHHLESSDYVPHKNAQSYSNINRLKNNRKKIEPEDETSVDVLEVYRVNKDLFAKILKDTDGSIGKSFCTKPEARPWLARSGSYPSPRYSQIKNFKSSKLDHKQNEVWSHTKVLEQNQQIVDPKTKHSRRTLSLNEVSLEKYAQLLPLKSSVKLNSSKSLRLTNECSFKRIRSLSHVDSYSAIQIEPYMESSKVENDNRLCEGVEGIGSNEETEDLCNSGESISEYNIPKIRKEMEEQTLMVLNSEKEEETGLLNISENEEFDSSPFSVVQSNAKEEVPSPTYSLGSKGFDCGHNCADEKEYFVDSQLGLSSGSLSRSSSIAKSEVYEIADEIKLHKRSYDDFDYVSDVLDHSGFKQNDLNALWYSVDQPLNPSIFHEVEARWPHSDPSPEDEFCCHHQLLFDLINECLVQIYDTWFTYYQRALSSNCHVPPVPVNFSILEEVWGRISTKINSKVYLDQTVEGIVAQDMWSDDHRWMNLQLENECVAIELEDMFFDELLDEIICSMNSC